MGKQRTLERGFACKSLVSQGDNGVAEIRLRPEGLGCENRSTGRVLQ